MALPVAASDVILVLNPTSLSEAQVAPFITAADSIVQQLNEKCGQDFDVDQLEQIEIFLAAHFASFADPKATEEKFENASKKYARGNNNLAGVLSTQYGQTANMLANGCLTDFDKTNSVVQFA